MLPDLPVLSVFLAAAVVLTITPGPDMLYVASRSLGQGRVVGVLSAFGVWSVPEKAIGFGIILGAVQAHGNIDAPLPPGPSFFRFSEAAECRRCLGEAGFAAIEVVEVPMTWTLPSAVALVRAAYEGTVRTNALLEAQTPDARAAIDAAIAAAAEGHATPDGRLEIPMSAMLATARKG